MRVSTDLKKETKKLALQQSVSQCFLLYQQFSTPLPSPSPSSCCLDFWATWFPVSADVTHTNKNTLSVLHVHICAHCVTHRSGQQCSVLFKMIVLWPGDLLLSYITHAHGQLGIISWEFYPQVTNINLNNVGIHSFGSYTNWAFALLAVLKHLYSSMHVFDSVSEGKGEGRYHWLMQCDFG